MPTTHALSIDNALGNQKHTSLMFLKQLVFHV